MEKQEKQNFIELPYSALKKKYTQIPQFLFQTKLQRCKKNLTQIKSLLQQLNFQYISYVSNDRHMLAAKHSQTHRISLIQIKEYNHKSKCVYLSINLTSCLREEIRGFFQMKTWKFQEKVLMQDEKTGKGLVFIQYGFVECDLRTQIQRVQAKRERIQVKELRKIAKDLIENLCEYHLNNVIVGHITPETILYENNNWFILCGDYSEQISQDVGNKLNQPLCAPASLKYCSPLQYNYESSSKQNPHKFTQTIISRPTHNAFKTDVYCLGLCLAELQLTNIVSPLDIHSALLERRSELTSMILKCDQSFRQNYILQPVKGQRGCYRQLKVPNYLQLMLGQPQSKRSYIFQTCLITNFTNPLLRRFKVPFQPYFKCEISAIPNSQNRKKIAYPHASLQYQGEVLEKKYCLNRKQITRDGRGVMMYNGVKSFQGTWRNNQPHGRCEIRFSQTLVYEGELIGDQFHGNGALRFNDTLLGTNRWYKNLPDDSYFTPTKSTSSLLPTTSPPKPQPTPCLQFQNGIYLILQNSCCPDDSPRLSIDQSKEKEKENTSQFEYKIYYTAKWNRQYNLTFNLVYLGKNLGSIVRWIVWGLVQASNSVTKIDIRGVVNQSVFNSKPSQQLQLTLTPHKTLTILTAPSQSFPFLVQFLSECTKKHGKPLTIKCLHADNIPQLHDEHVRDLSNLVGAIQEVRLARCGNIGDQGFCGFFRRRGGDKGDKGEKEGGLRVLDLSETRIQDKGIDQLLYWSGLSKVREIYLKGCKRISQDKLYELLHSQKLSQLQKLDLSHTNLTNKTLQKLSQSNSPNSLSPHQQPLRSLTSLHLSLLPKLTQPSLSTFLSHPTLKLKKLKHLSFRSCSIKDPVLERLGESGLQLDSLCLAGCVNLTLEALWGLFGGRKMEGLGVVDFSGLSVDDRFLGLLADYRQCGLDLRQLVLEQCRFVTDKGLTTLLKSPSTLSLQTLTLTKTRTGNTTLSTLSCPTHPNLTNLSLSKCSNITDEGLQKFALSPTFSQLEYLDLGGTAVGVLFVGGLVERGNGEGRGKLRELGLGDCGGLGVEERLGEFLGSRFVMGLDVLDLTNTPVTDACLTAFKKSSLTNPNLTLLKLSSPKPQSSPKQPIHSLSLSLSLPAPILPSQQSPSQQISNLCRQGYLLKLTQLKLDNECRQLNQINQIFRSAHICNLGVLKFCFVDLGPFFQMFGDNRGNIGGINGGINGVGLNLVEFSVTGCRFSEKGLMGFLASKSATRIKRLDLSWTECSSQVLTSLIQSQIRLQSLNLSKCIKINDRNLVKYLSSPSCESLLQLDLRSTLITNSTLESIFSSKHLQNLKKLIVRACQNIRYIGFKNILSSKCGKSLEYLDISWTNVQGAIWGCLAGGGGGAMGGRLGNLGSLLVAGLRFTDLELGKFLGSENSGGLSFIDLSFTNIGIQFFTSSPKYKSLKFLQKLDLKGLQSHTIRKGWPQFSQKPHIKELTITDNDPNLQKLLSMLLDSSKELQKIIVSGATAEKIEYLRKVLKTERVFWEGEGLEDGE